MPGSGNLASVPWFTDTGVPVHCLLKEKVASGCLEDAPELTSPAVTLTGQYCLLSNLRRLSGARPRLSAMLGPWQ